MMQLPLLLIVALQTELLPLPEHTDIPEGYSTVICPDRTAAERMLTEFYAVAPAPRNHTHVIPLFFEGLEATGCIQGGPLKVGTITIEAVLMRRSFEKADGTEQVIAFQGVNAEGTPLVGIVDETGNNAYPRSPLEFWLEHRSDDGTVTVDPRDTFASPAYRCPSIAAANAAVTAIPDYDEEQTDERAVTAAFQAALERNQCSRADGGFTVIELGETRSIFCGYECAYDWTALAAQDAEGQVIGLIYDGSMM